MCIYYSVVGYVPGLSIRDNRFDLTIDLLKIESRILYVFRIFAVEIDRKHTVVLSTFYVDFPCISPESLLLYIHETTSNRLNRFR